MKFNRFLFALSGVQLALFVPLAWWAHRHPHPSVELTMTHRLQEKRSPFWRMAIRAFSTLAGEAMLLNVLVIPTAIIFWKRRLRLEAAMTIGISWTSTLVRTVIKQTVNRPRPSPLLVHMSRHKKTKSFPSGHVTSSVDFWGWLVALNILLMRRHPPQCLALLGLPTVFVVLVGPSRIYLGEHWATDVVGGYLFGGGWLALSLQLYLALRENGVLAGQG
jgi:membrane-associated phospholipid phosphatase